MKAAQFSIFDDGGSIPWYPGISGLFSTVLNIWQEVKWDLQVTVNYYKLLQITTNYYKLLEIATNYYKLL